MQCNFSSSTFLLKIKIRKVMTEKVHFYDFGTSMFQYYNQKVTTISNWCIIQHTGFSKIYWKPKTKWFLNGECNGLYLPKSLVHLTISLAWLWYEGGRGEGEGPPHFDFLLLRGEGVFANFWFIVGERGSSANSDLSDFV